MKAAMARLAPVYNTHRMVREYAEKACAGWPGSKVEVEIKQYYRNMKYDLEKEPRAMAYALEGVKRTGRYRSINRQKFERSELESALSDSNP